MEVGYALNLDTEGQAVNATIYRQLVGSLIYLITTRPDISYSVGVISRFMQELKISHCNCCKKNSQILERC